MPERDARREGVARVPHVQPVPPHVPERHEHRRDQSAVEHAARSRQRQQLTGVAAVVVELDDVQQELGADEGADDDVDAQVEHPRRVETARLGALHREAQAEARNAAASSTP
jgi:hypothetical protein